MKFIIALLLTFSLSSPAKMSHEQAFNTVNGILAQLKFNAAENAKLGKALSMIKVLVARRTAADAATNAQNKLRSPHAEHARDCSPKTFPKRTASQEYHRR